MLSRSDMIIYLTDIYKEAEYNFAFWDTSNIKEWRIQYAEAVRKIDTCESDFDFFMLLKSFVATLENGHRWLHGKNS